MNFNRQIMVVWGLLCVLPAGCASPPVVNNADGIPATGPATRLPERQFSHAPTGLTLNRPLLWVDHPSPDFVLRIASLGTNPDAASITVDVPELPPHIPGLIPIGLVKDGYVDDLKKAHPDAVAGEAEVRDIDGAKARLVGSRWTERGQDRHENAMLIVKGDHVVIVRASSDTFQYLVVLKAFQEIIASIRWEKVTK